MPHSLSIKNDMLLTPVFTSVIFYSFPLPHGPYRSDSRRRSNAGGILFCCDFFLLNRQAHEGVYLLFFFLYSEATAKIKPPLLYRRRQGYVVPMAYPQGILCRDQRKYAIAKAPDAARPSSPPASLLRNCNTSLFFKMSWNPCASATCRV